MAMKDLLYRLQPVQMYTVLALSIVYFLVQLFLSHTTHALTLLVDSYHMLCNIVALSGCIMTIKHCNNGNDSAKVSQSTISKASDESKFIELSEQEVQRQERSLRNTFGWTRIDILTMLIVGIFLAAFCFSLLVEAIQTLIHIDHQDTMHHPIAVIALGLAGLVLNAICYLLIGGYTYHQGSFLHITPSGDVVLERVVTGNGVRKGERRLSKTRHDQTTTPTPSIETKSTEFEQETQKIRKHTVVEVLRDISSTLFVIVCALIVFFANDENVTKFIDPIMSIVSCVALLWLSYPYMRESCLILLQTIPGSIDIEVFKTDLLKTFDDIASVHDLHIWQLTSSKYVSTVHILFQDPIVYVEIKDAVVNFFHDQGITIVTIQPEFQEKSVDKKESKLSLNQCLIGCQSVECAPKTCCSTNDLDTIITGDPVPKQPKFKKSKNSNKSNSLLSLNVTSLTKFRKITGSAPDIIKKSVSESHVEQFGGDSELSECVTPNVSQTQLSDNLEKENHEVNTPQAINTTDTQQKKIENNSESSHVDCPEELNLLAKSKSESPTGEDRKTECENIEETSLKSELEK